MAAPPPLFSDLYNLPAKWDEPTPDYAALILRLGGTPATGGTPAIFDRRQTMTGLANLVRRSPTLIAFCPADDNNYIYVGHSVSLYPTNPLNNLGFDGNLITIVGNDPNSCQPVALPSSAFKRATVRAKTIDEIRGAAGFGGSPAVLRQGPHTGTTPDTESLLVRRVMLIPNDSIPDILTALPGGYYTYPAFYDNFLEPALSSGVTAVEQLYAPLAQWWRAVCTAATATTSALEVTPTAPANLRERRFMDRWASKAIEDLNVRLGHGGPALSSAAFAAGIADVRNVIETTNQANLDAERNRRNITFEDRHGAALATRLYRWTGATDHASLPEVHRVLISTPKLAQYGTLNALLQARASTSNLQIATMNMCQHLQRRCKRAQLTRRRWFFDQIGQAPV